MRKLSDLTAVDGEARGHDAAGNTTSIGSRALTYNEASHMDAVRQGNGVLESYDYSPVALINVPSPGVPELPYVQPDHLGTPRVVIDPVRDVAIWEWSNKSEVFGNQIPSADPDGDGVAFELALRFPGQQATDGSGMFYNYQREYDLAVGRYSQSDPIGLAGGAATYAYTAGNPISFADPLGLQSAPPGTTKNEAGGWEVDVRYWLDRALQALALPVSTPVAAVVQTNSFRDMRQDNTVGNDKYFHCIANCQSKRLAGDMAACAVAGMREDSQDLSNRHNEDRHADEAANAVGRARATGGGACQQQCSQFIVNGINTRYLPGGP